jgi:RNA polymerase sigma factor (sigma-70 family)
MDLRMTDRGQRDPDEEPSDGASPDPTHLDGGNVKRGTSASEGGREHALLVEAATSGDAQARESLIREHLNWVRDAAGERTGRGLSEGDLVQEGSLGLMKAIDQFPESGRTDFEAFAHEQVAEQMENALAEEDHARDESRRLLQAAEDFQKAEFGLKRELGRDATPAELAAKLEWTRERTDAMAEIVAEARRRHDEELITYLDPDDLDLDRLLEGAEEVASNQSGSPEANGGSGSPGQGHSSAER